METIVLVIFLLFAVVVSGAKKLAGKSACLPTWRRNIRSRRNIARPHCFRSRRRSSMTQDQTDDEHKAGTPPQMAPKAFAKPEIGRLKNGRFKKGFTGNAKGRPRKPERAWSRRRLDLDILREANMLVPIKVNGKTEFITKHQLLHRQLVARAINGDMKAYKLVLDQHSEAQSSHERRNMATFAYLEQCELEAEHPPLSLSKEEFQETINVWRKHSRS